MSTYVLPITDLMFQQALLVVAVDGVYVPVIPMSEKGERVAVRSGERLLMLGEGRAGRSPLSVTMKPGLSLGKHIPSDE